MSAALDVNVTLEELQNVSGPLAAIVGAVVVFPTVTLTGEELTFAPDALVTNTA